METLVSNDGRYVITLGDFGGGVEQAAAAGIYDLQTGACKVFALDQLLTKEDLEKQGNFVGYYRHWHWFRTPDSIVWNEDAKRVEVSVGVNKRDVSGPMIVIDHEAMTATREPAAPWLLEHNKRVAEQQTLEELTRDLLSDEEQAAQEFLRGMTRIPETTFFRQDKGYLCRLKPGKWLTRPTMLVLRFNDETREFDHVQEIALKNPVAPHRVLFSSDMHYLVTFDEWNQIGGTPNTIVIYQLETGENKAFSLDSFCSPEQVASLKMTWRVSLWRQMFAARISFAGAEFERVDHEDNQPKDYPHVLIDVQNLEVKLAEPFRLRDISSQAGQ